MQPWNKGIPHTEEQKQKMRLNHKGRTGQHLSEETKAKISISNISSQKRKLANMKLSNDRVGKLPKNMQNRGTYRNVQSGWYDIGARKHYFRSKWEANYALYLEFLMKNNRITKWEFEPDVFVFDKIKFGTRSYRPDFKISNLDSTIEYHEVKGYMDAQSKTKLKRMKKYYPLVKIVLIGKDEYKDILKWKALLKFY